MIEKIHHEPYQKLPNEIGNGTLVNHSIAQVNDIVLNSVSKD
jgi:hypothetical protein